MSKVIGTDRHGVDITMDDIKEDADLQFADLTGAELQGANLQWADLGEARLWRAKYCNNTIFPTSFEPKKHGMINVDEADNEK